MYEQLKNILLECGIEESLVNCDDYIKADIIDSLTMAEIIIAIEDAFNIEIDPEEIVPENFVNIGTITDLVSRYC